jgi:hypothetical protein
MTVRGGGVPYDCMAFLPRYRMGPPPRSFAADAHHCIMVWVSGPAEYKHVARSSCTTRGLPSYRHPDTLKCAVVLEAVKDEPSVALTRHPLTTSARAGSHLFVGRGEETGCQVEQGNSGMK